ncbi:MAG: N-acetylgalactosamine-6-sulfatase [Calditrichaeota bacterium]|nr:MAG: N-acetylgalactosamine-6-sulfatase [Calditrichota bacterium]
MPYPDPCDFAINQCSQKTGKKEEKINAFIQLKNRGLLILYISLLFALAGCTEPAPNIILLMGDDHGWDETGYNGHPHLQTPVLDEMAASGLQLDRFYAGHPTCSPTRGSVLTGRHPNRYGTFTPNRSIRPEEITITQILGEAGYATGHFGKWHLGPVKAASPTNPGAMGFDEWLSHDNFFELNPYFSRNGGPPEQFHGESSKIIIDETIHFIEKAKKNKRPFFAVVWFGSPHEPYSGLQEDLALYENLPAKYKEQLFRLTSNETGRPTQRPLDKVLQERYAEITAMDRAIGHLRDWLAKTGLRQNTIIWYCGDNGTSGDGIVTSPFRGKKGSVYEGGIRVPGIIEWPEKINHPKRSPVNTVTSDILPTICEIVGLPVPDRPLDGISLKPLLDGKMKERPDPILFWQFNTDAELRSKPYIAPELQKGTTPLVKMAGGHYTRNFRNFHQNEIGEQHFSGASVLLGNRYKLVIDGQPGHELSRELFDVRADSSEKINLTKRMPGIADSLEQQLRGWQESVLKSLTGDDYK